jgi:putative oligomerization/nucleic acid binding protein
MKPPKSSARDLSGADRTARSLLRYAPVAFLVGCASTGVVPMGQNLYTIAKTSPACGFRDAGGVRAEIFQEMTAFCSGKSLAPEVVTLEALDGVIGRRCASATVEFRCVTAADSENFTPTGKRPDRDLNRNPSIPADRGQFGRKADEPIQIEQEIRFQEQDIYAELKKLKELLDVKIITQEEFDSRKKKILAR